MRILKVQGKGQVAAEPDLIMISFDIESKAKDYEESLRQLNTRVDDLRGSMSASGLDRARLKTTAYNVRVETQYSGGKHIFGNYVASHRLQIELQVEKELLNNVLRQIAQGQSGAEIKLTFSVKDKDALRKKVLTQAVQSAKENAATLALAAGVTLGKLIQMDYGWSEVHIYDREANILCESKLSYSLSDPDIEPEDVKAEDTVTLVFEIAE